MLTGSLVALITPMHEDGSVNFQQLETLIDWHIANGTDGIVAVGTAAHLADRLAERDIALVWNPEFLREGFIPPNAFPSLPARGATALPKQSPFRKPPNKRVRTTPCQSSPTTTNRPKKAFTAISKPLPNRSISR